MGAARRARLALDSDSDSNSPPAGDADNPSSRVQAQSLEPGKEALGSLQVPQSAPLFASRVSHPVSSVYRSPCASAARQRAAASGACARCVSARLRFGARLRARQQAANCHTVEPRAGFAGLEPGFMSLAPGFRSLHKTTRAWCQARRKWRRRRQGWGATALRARRARRTGRGSTENVLLY